MVRSYIAGKPHEAYVITTELFYATAGIDITQMHRVHKLRQISRLFVPTLAWLCGKDCIKLYILRCFLCQVYLYVEYISN